MMQLKLIKNKLKKNKEWDEYKSIFRHKQMRLATTKVALIFNKEVSKDIFYKVEKDLIKSPNDENMFENAYKVLKEEVKYEADWESLSKYMWYQLHASTYYKDKKNKSKNIFKERNIVKTNEVRRKYFLKWLHSINSNDKEFNEKIMQVLKLVN